MTLIHEAPTQVQCTRELHEASVDFRDEPTLSFMTWRTLIHEVARVCVHFKASKFQLASLKSSLCLWQVVRSTIWTMVGDGATCLQRAMRLSQHIAFPNLRLVLRDLAHMARIALKEPAAREARFGEFFDELFNGKNALVAEIMRLALLRASAAAAAQPASSLYFACASHWQVRYSAKMQHDLESAQNVVLREGRRADDFAPILVLTWSLSSSQTSSVVPFWKPRLASPKSNPAWSALLKIKQGHCAAPYELRQAALRSHGAPSGAVRPSAGARGCHACLPDYGCAYHAAEKGSLLSPPARESQRCLRV